jgi:hypothetical protein
MKTKFLLFVLSFFVLLSCTRVYDEVIEPEPVVSGKLTTFDKHIKPILAVKCSPCHTKAGDRINKWDNYNTTKTLITGVMGRITKDRKDPLFMPQKGTPLDKEEMDLMNKWINDGLVEE